jgi:hypothetical protein
MMAEPATTYVTVSDYPRTPFLLEAYLGVPNNAACYIVWSNFEIADMDFWRGDTYMSFFEFLDQKGGFYYEVSSFSVG